MSQSDSILDTFKIKDKNIKLNEIINDHYYSDGKRIEKTVLRCTLTYRLTRCPHCGFKNIIKNGTKLTKLKLNNIIRQETIVELKKQRYLCKDCHGTCGAKTTLVKSNHSITQVLIDNIKNSFNETLTVKYISKLFSISPSSVQRIAYKNQKAIVHHNLPENLCFDEFRSVNSQFSFICIDAEKHNYVAMLPNRLTKDIIDYFIGRYSLDERKQVRTVTIDLNANYQNFIRRLFPNAEIIIDRFHIIQLVGRALDQDRLRVIKNITDHRNRIYKALKLQWRQFHIDENELDGTKFRYFFGINEYLTPQGLVDLGVNYDNKFKASYETYQAILDGIRNQDPNKINEVIKNYKRNNSAMDTAITTLKRNITGVMNACIFKHSNGPLEGIIRKIKTLKRVCYGFKRMDHLFIRSQLIHK